MLTAEDKKKPAALTGKVKPEKNNIDIKTSFTAADSIPIKVLLDKEVIHHATSASRLIPVHIQFLPTNKCNLNCEFCSCSERDKSQEIEFDKAKRIIEKCSQLGTKAVTITGGGEPLLYRKFNELIEHFWINKIKIGLVSNGLLLNRTDPKVLNKMTWCRISNSDERIFDDVYKKRLSKVVTATLDVDWAFSHVVSTKPNLEEIVKIIKFANEHSFTHVRLVSDLFQPEVVAMDRLKTQIRQKGIDDSKVIYQERKAYSRGGDCYIGFIKPLIGADAKVYACCGVQYALAKPSKDLPEELCLGDALDMEKIIDRSSEPLNGNICAKCYYMNYNILLKGILKGLEHKEFV